LSPLIAFFAGFIWFAGLGLAPAVLSILQSSYRVTFSY
jgi:hypothetical protein